MRDNPRPFEIFNHFKGKQYQVLALAKDSEDGRDLVVYQALYGEYTIYVRSLEEFMGPVDKIKYPGASQEHRFERCAKSFESQAAEDKTKTEEITNAETAVEKKTEADTETKGKTGTEKEAKTEPAEADPGMEEGMFLDPMVEEFLDADSVYEKLNILAGLHHRITDDMLDIMASASDIELNEGSTKERYAELKNCLLMMERYECKRIR